MEREKKKVNWLKVGRKCIVTLGIILSPILLMQIGYYCTDYYRFSNINVNTSNYIPFLIMLSFMVVIVLVNLINTYSNHKLTKEVLKVTENNKELTSDIHNILQILLQVVLEDSEKIQTKIDDVLLFINKYRGDK